jgi:glutamate 5-kinase
VAAGLKPLGFTARPTDLASVQAAASVGQSHLIAEYDQAFARHGIVVSQVLLTAGDTVRRHRYENSRRTLDRLLQLHVIPIVNENDAVTVAELKFGDNDRLAALTALLVRADGLVLLTDVPGLYDKSPNEPDARRIPFVANLHDVDGISISSKGSSVGTGGMVTKVHAVQIATTSGIPTILAATSQINEALNGDDVGTYFAAGHHRKASGRMHWLAHAAVVRGRLILDDGAVNALRNTGASLLAVGVVNAINKNKKGDPVELIDNKGKVIARGLATFNSIELPQLLGRNSRWLREAFGDKYDRPVVHRDELVLLD